MSGPTRIYVRRIPGGAVLNLEHYLTRILVELADDPDLFALLTEAAEDRAAARPYDGHEPEALLIERLVAELGADVPLYGDRVRGLAERLLACAPPPAGVRPAGVSSGVAA